jgi:hypothetical protein
MSTVFSHEQERGRSNQAGHYSERAREKDRCRGEQHGESGLNPRVRCGLGLVYFLSRLGQERDRHFG